MKSLRSIAPLWLELKSYLSRAYPDFVTSARPGPLTGVPIFMLHSAEPVSFETQLRHLAENGYRTIDCDTLLRYLAGDLALKGPTVMLTFDDGERSLYRVAYPLLKKYGLTAVNFIVPGRVFERDADRPAEGKQWLTWPEVLEMHRSEVIDFQSHTMWHETMFVGDTLRDFLRPGRFSDGLLVDRPRVRDGHTERLLLEPGAPLYDIAPRMMDRPKFHDEAAPRNACTQYVATQGGEAFFNRPGWRSELMRVWQKARADRPAGTFETPEEQRAALRESLLQSRELLAERLGRPVRHLAYPWSSGGRLSVEVSRETGYASNFWGPIPGVDLNRPGQNPFHIARIKDDYILRLPGKNRASLLEVLFAKARRRARHADIY